MDSGRTSTYQKAHQINLDSVIHGTFAEIGAGQEVARWFFHVGGAASTVAKTMSAYDMAVSDAIYGLCDHYVSRRRLQAMLEYEYELLLQQLSQDREATTSFFVFADTVAARSYARREEGHGWMGIRFQHQPQAEPCEIIIHVRMLDGENVREQEALGILGVNLIYGAFYHHHEPTALIRSLMDDLARGRVEIDMIRFSGPFFAGIDNRLMSLQLVEQGFTDAAMFTADGEVVQPAEILHKKPVLIVRGSFRPITHPIMDMLERSSAQFPRTLQGTEEPPVVVMEMSLRNLLSGDHIDHNDFLARVDILGSLGKTVMISSYPTYYQLAEYLRHYSPKRIVFPMGILHLKELFEQKYYADLDGGILEAFGRFFTAGVTLYIYPSKDPETGAVMTVESLRVAPHLRFLYAYLLENNLLEPIKNVDEKHLHILPRDVLARIQAGDPAWETMVPESAGQLIKDRKLFRWQPAVVPVKAPKA